MGCRWNIPANYDAGVFETCDGDTGLLQGIYGSSTFRQGDPVTPSAHPAPSSSQCSTARTISHGLLAVSQNQTSTVASSSTASEDATSTMTRVNSPSSSPSSAGTSGSSSGSTGSSNSNQNNAASSASTLTISAALAGLVAVGAAVIAL
ncbi:hypothetical protein NDA16_001267 [Ustilago loliicola]|nr:hypothetical protein NDA16_001267 [Ustilago loliicola]